MTRAVAVDLGTRRIGIAVSDSAGALAFPRPLVERCGDRAAEHVAIERIVDEVGAQILVVGLPLCLDGRRGPAALAAAQEATELARRFSVRGVDVVTFDERYTTVEAEAGLVAAGRGGRARRARVDSAAATVLLQSWLDAR
ncbi:MAG: Holliday junction resolvase RuvX [Acidimicrobiales bacterium]